MIFNNNWLESSMQLVSFVVPNYNHIVAHSETFFCNIVFHLISPESDKRNFIKTQPHDLKNTYNKMGLGKYCKGRQSLSINKFLTDRINQTILDFVFYYYYNLMVSINKTSEK